MKAKVSKIKVTYIIKILLTTWIFSLANASVSSFRGTIIPDFNNKVVSDVIGIDIQNSENIIECVRKCGNEQHCLSVFYNNVTKKCQMHSEWYNISMSTTDSNGFRYYIVSKDPVCPNQKGYLITDSYNLCIRFSNEKVTQENAQKMCENDYGHLLVITFGEMDIYVRSLLPTTEYYWVSGSDASIEGDWRYWNGESMPDVFAAGEPTGGSTENCVLIYNVFGIADIRCDAILPFICQIDV